MPVTRKLRRSRRAAQMREAQRRRRQRLKDQRLSFLQIILPERLRERLVTLSDATGVTLQEAALDILIQALAPEPVNVEEAFRQELGTEVRPMDAVPRPKSDTGTAPAPSPAAAVLKPSAAPREPANSAQLDLF